MGTGRAARRAETARRIRTAAREEFVRHGYDGATIRAIASRAGVDPSLVMQHHGSKAALFASVSAVDDDTARGHLDDVVRTRLAGLPPQMHALVRSMLTVPAATTAMRDHLDERAANLAAGLDGDDAALRAAVIVSSILGLTVARHFLGLRALDGVSDEDVARVARTLWGLGADAVDAQR